MAVSPAAAILIAIGLTLFLMWVSLLVAVFSIGRVWVRAVARGTPLPLVRIVAMRLRGSPAALIVDAYSALRQRGVAATIDDVERVWLEEQNAMLSIAELADRVAERRGGA